LITKTYLTNQKAVARPPPKKIGMDEELEDVWDFGQSVFRDY
jgi:hypothetical protein